MFLQRVLPLLTTEQHDQLNHGGGWLECVDRLVKNTIIWKWKWRRKWGDDNGETQLNHRGWMCWSPGKEYDDRKVMMTMKKVKVSMKESERVNEEGKGGMTKNCSQWKMIKGLGGCQMSRVAAATMSFALFIFFYHFIYYLSFCSE